MMYMSVYIVFNEDLTVFPILNPKRKKITNLTMDQLQAPALPYKKRQPLKALNYTAKKVTKNVMDFSNVS